MMPASSSPSSVSHHRDLDVSNILYMDSVKTSAAARNAATAASQGVSKPSQGLKMLYTPEERVRRDATKWTLVQGILAPVQFLVFLISLALVELRRGLTPAGVAGVMVSLASDLSRYVSGAVLPILGGETA